MARGDDPMGWPNVAVHGLIALYTATLLMVFLDDDM